MSSETRACLEIDMIRGMESPTLSFSQVMEALGRNFSPGGDNRLVRNGIGNSLPIAAVFAVCFVSACTPGGNRLGHTTSSQGAPASASLRDPAAVSRQDEAGNASLQEDSAAGNESTADSEKSSQDKSPFGGLGPLGDEQPVANWTAIEEVRQSDPPLELRSIAENVWLHTSYKNLPELGPYPSNGLLVVGTEGVVVVDTAWGMDRTEELIEVTERNWGTIGAVIVTHFHEDRAGGLDAFHARGIPSYGSARTIEQAQAHDVTAPRNSLAKRRALEDLGVDLETFYPGPGHTKDNIVVWLPGAHLLFGGCLVKASDSTSLGNVEDADIEAWSDSVLTLQQKFGEARLIVPGHGEPGGPLLLSHTRQLAEQATRAP